ncbi:fucose isomerase [Pedobacter alpinus]|uniref:Fucose isomerase n=1 Tax=Pedobacter alpinus TaxID=1590643 RepID=A0ABW5TM01_9SPHI
MMNIYLLTSGDLRLSANQSCWEAQHKMNQQIIEATEALGGEVIMAHDYDEEKKHGFIDSQKMGMRIFKNLVPFAPVIIAESVWQYSHHVLAGLTTHEGPILTLANWSGQWPGLVGMLNLNGSLTKAGVNYSTLWSKDFKDEFFINGLKQWMKHGEIKHDEDHVKPFNSKMLPLSEITFANEFAENFRSEKAIMGVFDEGCMGMFNAIVPDHLLHPTGIFKERLSQSTLYAKMLTVKDEEVELILEWLLLKGMHFNWGNNEATELTKAQTLIQCKMYIAALRLADEFGCSTIGIQYQQGLKDLVPASDLVEGLLNNQDRPPVFDEKGKELYANEALPHFNEVDECAGIDGLITYELWRQLGLAGENTLHDLRYGEKYAINGVDEFVWVFLISGAAPPAHFIGGYKGASSERQPEMYFRLGGGSLKGVSKPGAIVWSRIYVMNNHLCCDIGVGECVELPEEEVQRRWNMTTSQWPIMNAVLKGVSQDQMMGRHKANHIQVVYTTNEEEAHKCCRIKAAVFNDLGIKVNFCGDVVLS